MLTIKDLEFVRTEKDHYEIWIGNDHKGEIVKYIPRGLTARRNCAGPQSAPHQWLFIHPEARTPTVLNEGGNLRQAKKQSLRVLGS